MAEGLEKVIATLFHGRMTVMEYVQTEDEQTGIVSCNEAVVMSDIPCRLSYSHSTPVTEGMAAENIQKIKVFYSPNVTIKPGSKLIISQNGVEAAYRSSGVPRLYSGHAEVDLEYFERWS